MCPLSTMIGYGELGRLCGQNRTVTEKSLSHFLHRANQDLSLKHAAYRFGRSGDSSEYELAVFALAQPSLGLVG